jgi:mercuric ion transport protein
MVQHDTVSANGTTPADAPTGLLATVGTVLGLGALLASSCCVLPLLLGGLGAGAGVFTALEALSPLRLPLLALGGFAVMVGWWLWWRKHSACTPPRFSRAVLGVLVLASLVVATATAWVYLEPVLLKLMRVA